MKLWHHIAAHAAAITLGLGILVLLLVHALGGQTHPQVRATANAQIKQRAVTAAVLSQQVPNPSCNPAPGAGHVGACAPVQAEGQADLLAKAAGDPGSVNGPLGIDRSSFQGYTSVRGLPISFEIAKATEGTYYTDSTLRFNVADAKANHLAYSEYDFLRPGSSSATAEASRFVQAVKAAGGQGGIPPVADLEANAGLSPSGVHAYVCQWGAVVKAGLHVSRFVIYTGNWFFAASVSGDSCGADLWVSAYTLYPIIPAPWHGGFTLWQYSGDGIGLGPHCWRGLGCQIDSDVFHGTAAQLAAYVHAAPPAKPIPRRFTADCTTLDRITFWKHHNHGHVSSQQHQQAVAIRARLARNRIGCTAQPRSVPYRYPHRKGALA